MIDSVEYNKITKPWHEYNQVRLSGNKKKANLLLKEFIFYLKTQQKIIVNHFIEDVCNLTFEEESQIIFNNGDEVSSKTIRIQHPLFKEIIIHRLIEYFTENNAKGIKWIGQFEQFFYSDFNLKKKFLEKIGVKRDFDTAYFFEKSFHIDQNQTSLQLLMSKIARDISYLVHEVPVGVLSEPDQLDEELAYFNRYWQLSENKKYWEKSKNSWEKISLHWRRYFENKNNYTNFENYLDKNKIKLDE